MGFPGYFLIVADFIQWAKDNGIPVGPGRGSGAGSLVAYALKITDLDPLEHELLFERFLNPERVSMPDFDVDFCMEGRDRVIDYVAAQVRPRAVSQIITFGTMAAKAVVRDVGRVLGPPLRLRRQGRQDGPVRAGHDAGQGPGGERGPEEPPTPTTRP
jgi:DNA polymerase-3 subunit alpha